MPGKEYYDSIVNFWRVYSGYTPNAADACKAFLSKVINIRDYPLTHLNSTTASETAKLLENSYRAVNIAFMEEWGRFAESVGIDLFEVIKAIRARPTHSNIRQPGFGVGGYCLTKDPLFASIAAQKIFGLRNLEFPFCTQSVEINNRMPLVTLDKVEKLLGGKLVGKRILLCGVSYRPDIGDTRLSPSQTFVENATERGAIIMFHDPMVNYWSEMDVKLPKELPDTSDVDAVVFTVGHEEYKNIDFKNWIEDSDIFIFDANNVLTKKQRTQLKELGIRYAGIGRGGVR